ncbi:MAG: hypothetical protein MJ062_04395 [Oscillospiraceae bacterium]|nr:hypothetical protein [Oscillospiraceae bacterium]
MDFLEQLKQEVQTHGEQEIDFRSRRFQHGRDLARTYIDIIKDEARLSARSGQYQNVGNQVIISGFCRLTDRDFDLPPVQMQKRQSFWTGKWSEEYTLTQGNDLFEAFQTSFAEFCAEEHIAVEQFQAKIRKKDGKIVYRPLPVNVTAPEVLEGFGFPFEITL